MIILSQDKTKIINFDNVNTLRVIKDGLIVSYENTYKAEDDCSNILGIYKTEERAKEVLNEIMENYKNWEYTKMGKLIIGKVVCDTIYTMPED
jgi:hypothetical protein